jgi:hypothetical protein
MRRKAAEETAATAEHEIEKLRSRHAQEKHQHKKSDDSANKVKAENAAKGEAREAEQAERAAEQEAQRE